MPEQLKIVIDADVQKAESKIVNFGKAFVDQFNKINNSANQLSADITSSINKINSSLASLKVTSVDISVDTSAIDASVKNIQSKFAALVDPEINILANTDLAEARIKELIAELARLKGSEIFIRANDTQALQKINEIEKELNSLVGKQINLSVAADLSKIKQLQDKINSLKVTPVDVVVNTALLDTQIKNIQAKFATLVDPKINVLADTTQAEAQIKELLSELGTLKGSEIFIKANDTQALSSINLIETELDSLLDKQIKLNINTAEATAKLSALENELADLQTLKIQPDVSTTQLALFEANIKRIQAEIATLKGQSIAIPIIADTTSILKAKTDLDSLIGRSIKVDVDATAALSKIAILEKELADLEKLSIQPNISSTQFEVFKKNIDQVKAKINELRGVGTFVFKADASELLSSIKSVDNAAKKLGRGGFDNFNQSLAKATTAATTLQTKASGLVNFYNKVGDASNRAAASIGGKFPRATNDASFAMLNFGRVIQDAPFGILGIANNLNPLVESMGRASAAAKATGTSLTKNLLGALKGPGGIGIAISVVSSLLIVFGDRLFGAGKKAKTAADDIEASNQHIKSLASTIADSLTKFTLLTGVIKNVNTSYDDKKKALAALNSEYKNYLDAIGVEKITVENLDAAYTKLTDTLLRQAVVKGVQNQISKEVEKIAEQIIKLSLPLEKTRAEFDNVANSVLNLSKGVKDIPEAKPILDTSKLITGFNQLKIATTDGVIAAQQLRTEVVKTQGDLNNFADVEKRTAKLTAQLKEELKKALAPLLFLAKGFDDLDLTIPPPKTDGIDKVMDDIIARAKLFAKQFGDTFVVPELEITFFKDKKAVFKEAQKLLEDIKTGDLKIKLPVLTEFELIPDNITPLTTEQLNDLTKRFFSDLKPIEANIVFDPTLTVDQIKLRNQQADLRKQFEDTFGNIGVKVFGKINFDNLAEGIAKATKQFANMKLVLDTLTASVSEGLANAFNSVFDAILEGKNVFKALGQAVQALVVDTIKAIAKMFILKAVTAALGGGGVVSGLGGLIGGFAKGNVANFGLSGAIGNRAFNNVIQITGGSRISGNDIVTSYTRTNNSNQRGG